MNNQRSEISVKNKYWIPKFRYLELKNFCLQYNDWKLALKEITLIQSKSRIEFTSTLSNPTELLVTKREQYEANIQLIERVAEQAEPTLAKWILRGVTENLSYEYLKYQLEIPAGRDMYYDRYRRFFWLLDREKKF